MLNSTDWLHSGPGLAPRIAWAFNTDAELSSLCQARETGDLFAVDSSGGMYRLNRAGKIQTLSRGLKNARLVRWSDKGDVGIAVCGTHEFCALDARLKIAWSSESPAEVLTAAIDSYGHNVALGLDNADTVLLNVDRKKLGQFHTAKPLKFIEFCVDKKRICGSADYGLLCLHRFDGSEVWSEKNWSTVGDLSITEGARAIYMAGFAHGVQCFDHRGSTRTSFVVEGTPSKVAASYFGERLVVSTAERHIYWLDSDGALLWAAETPDDVASLVCDPLGEWLVVGFASGRILRLDWESDAKK
jgi:hypothetical protein